MIRMYLCMPIQIDPAETVDYTEFDPAQITFAMTSPIGTVQCVQIGIEDDTVIEDDEQFEISLVLPDSDDDDGGGSLLAVTIEDNDGKFKPKISATCSNYYYNDNILGRGRI